MCRGNNTLRRTFGDINIANELFPEIFKLSQCRVDISLSSTSVEGVRGLLAGSVVEDVELEDLNLLRVLGRCLQREFLQSRRSLE
jgi:hypothetical protein